MAGFQILNKKEYPHATGLSAAFYLDLNLNQIIDRIASVWGSDIRPLYAYFPMDEECEAYRRAVYADVKDPEIYRILCDFMAENKNLTETRTKEAQVRSPLQKNVWLLKQISIYCNMFQTLSEALNKATLTSEGMLALSEYLKKYLSTDSYKEMQAKTAEILQELATFRFTVTYENDRMVISEADVSGTYETFIDQFAENNRVPFRNPFHLNPSLTELEEECLEILASKRPSLFASIKQVAEKYKDYSDETLLQFISELPFYLSFRAFCLKMGEHGYSFCTPTTKKEENMTVSNLYDLALACVAIKEDRKVISNSITYEKGESIFVLTGPNQGGKTTFARSLGQMIFFTKMGLDVPAMSANVHYFTDILTHFSVEESVETGRGKLKEELIRLSPMMAENKTNAFVIINELFTTAATYDAEIMGGKVIKHFVDHSCRGIYVTHLKELSTVHPKVTSLRAMLNDQKIQSFKIARSEAEESACAANQVNKYRLTYEQLKERL